MNPKITAEHLSRGAIVYVRQSSIGQVLEHTESQRRQYGLADSARSMGFASVTTIDQDLGRSGSGLVARPGFQVPEAVPHRDVVTILPLSAPPKLATHTEVANRPTKPGPVVHPDEPCRDNSVGAPPVVPTEPPSDRDFGPCG